MVESAKNGKESLQEVLYRRTKLCSLMNVKFCFLPFVITTVHRSGLCLRTELLKTKTHPLYNRMEKIFNGNKENGLKERWVFEIELRAIRNV
jgi:hypothetical protein